MIKEETRSEAFPQRKKQYTWLFVFLVTAAILTMNPFTFSKDWLPLMFGYGFGYVVWFILFFHPVDFFLNILMFVPLGIILLGFLHKEENPWGKKPFKRLFLVAAAASLTCELSQMFLPRSATMLDVVANVSGAVIGYAVIFEIRASAPGLLDSAWKAFSRLRTAAASLYTVFLFFLCISPYFVNSTRNWDAGYPLLAGNEATMDRPWSGNLYVLRLYNRALRPAEIGALYSLGEESAHDRGAFAEGLVAEYLFSDTAGGVLRNASSHGDALNFQAQAGVQALKGGGVRLQGGAALWCTDATGIIPRAVQGTSQLTVEVWLSPERLDQTGPARIVSLSKNADERNFTLGQQGRDIHFRVRTPLAGLNGAWISLKAGNALKDTCKVHIAATFYRGVERLYVNGSPRSELVRGDTDFLSAMVGLGQNRAAQAAFAFLFFFPAGWLWAGCFRRWKWIAGPLLLSAVNLAVQGFWHRAGQPFGAFFFALCLASGLAGIGGTFHNGK